MDWEIDPWLSAVSRGGLLQPNPEFVETLKKMEVDFDAFHGGPFNLDLEKGVIRRLVDKLCAKYSEEEVPRVAVVKYVRFRTFVRLKHLNLNIAEEKAAKRKASGKKSGYGTRRNARKARQNAN